MSSILSILGDDHHGMVEAVTDIIQRHHGNIVDSRMTLLGNTFAIIVQVDIGEHDKPFMLTGLRELAEERGLALNEHASGLRNDSSFLLYRAEIVTVDHPGIVHQVANFLAQHGCNIRDLNTHTTPAAHTATPIFSARILIEVPTSLSIASLKEKFFALGDEMNLDCSFESVHQLDD